MLSSHSFRKKKKKTMKTKKNQQPKWDEFDTDICFICFDGGQLLVCDTCPRPYHLNCHTPKLSKIPKGKFQCMECVAIREGADISHIVKTKKTSPCNKKIHADFTVNGQQQQQRKRRKQTNKNKLKKCVQNAGKKKRKHTTSNTSCCNENNAMEATEKTNHVDFMDRLVPGARVLVVTNGKEFKATVYSVHPSIQNEHSLRCKIHYDGSRQTSRIYVPVNTIKGVLTKEGSKVVMEENQNYTDNIETNNNKNIVFAVNYKSSLVDQFGTTSSSCRTKKENMDEANEMNASAIGFPLSSNCQRVINERPFGRGNTRGNTKDSSREGLSPKRTKKNRFQPVRTARRASERNSGTCKPAAIGNTKVKYNMALVPSLHRNQSFLQRFPCWWLLQREEDEQLQQKQQYGNRQHSTKKRRKSPRVTTKNENISSEQILEATSSSFIGNNGQCLQRQQEHHQSVVNEPIDGNGETYNVSTSPFFDDSCVVWNPSSRTEWMDSASEMTALCASAAFRRVRSSGNNNNDNDSDADIATQKSADNAPFSSLMLALNNNIVNRSNRPLLYPRPLAMGLSEDYIRDRIEVDDPLNGYQIRNKRNGWLQGFVLWTTFTAWNESMKWDSMHPMSGMPKKKRQQKRQQPSTQCCNYDHDGSLAAELETSPRSGDPSECGIVFHKVAEISIMGALGCGEYLLRMALEAIAASTNAIDSTSTDNRIKQEQRYTHVLVEATDSSKGFYERFGFVRVGAVCRYDNMEQKDTTKSNSNSNHRRGRRENGRRQPESGGDIMGYRHWTQSDEPRKSLEMFGGPSYMMCLKLTTTAVPNTKSSNGSDSNFNININSIKETGGGDSKSNRNALHVDGNDGRRGQPSSTSFLKVMLETLEISRKPMVKQLC